MSQTRQIIQLKKGDKRWCRVSVGLYYGGEKGKNWVDLQDAYLRFLVVTEKIDGVKFIHLSRQQPNFASEE